MFFCGTKINLNDDDYINIQIQPSLPQTKKAVIKKYSKIKVGLFAVIFIIGIEILTYMNTSSATISGNWNGLNFDFKHINLQMNDGEFTMFMPNSSISESGTYSISSTTHKDTKYNQDVFILNLTFNNHSTDRVRVWFGGKNTMYWADEQSRDLVFSRTSKKMSMLMEFIIFIITLLIISYFLFPNSDKSKTK